VEYKREAFDMFANLIADIQQDIAVKIFRTSPALLSLGQIMKTASQTLIHDEVTILGRGPAAAPAADRGPSGESRTQAEFETALRAATAPVRRETPKVGRNDPCPCGSGRKYKKCCGAAG
jgi:preprotein translocase subunit SecA